MVIWSSSRGASAFAVALLFSINACSDDSGSPSAPGHDGGSAPVLDSAALPFEPPLVWGVDKAADGDPAADVVEVELTAAPTSFSFQGISLRGMLAYNGQIPGPLIEAKVGDTIVVHFKNELEEPTTIHWHGLRISDEMDGNPRIQTPVQPGESFTYRFVAKEAGSYWYHPHVNTNQQVERGLYGALVIHDPQLPRYDLERQLVLDDILFDSTTGELPSFMGSMMEQMHGRFGNRLLTNGQPSHLVVGQAQQGKVERWRIVNTANARTMVLGLGGARFRVIGTDGGALKTPYTTERIEVPVGQRYDLEVSYDDPGKVELLLFVPTVNDAGQLVEQQATMFAVEVAQTGDVAPSVEWPALTPLIDEGREATREVTYELNGVQTASGLQWSLNGQPHADEPLFTFQEGETVRIKLINLAGPEHPFHLHGQFFHVVADRGGAQPGLKDTVLVPGMSTVEIVAYMDNPGRWMAHCHILEHAELGMMSELVVEPIAP